MSEIKRATLIPFTSEKSEEKKSKLSGKTVRISFVLPESNEGTCPVYNYKEELAAAKKKDKSKHENKHAINGKHTNGLDPFDEDDDDVRRIAQEMEAKYGMGPPTKTKRKGRKDDYADIGMGYDESDSFIDNTDGYDEMIPQNVTTLHGGFYINCGALEFKTDEKASSEIFSSSSSSEDEDESTKVNSSRKRVIVSSSSEDETETDKVKENKEGNVVKKRKIDTEIPSQNINKKKKLLTPDKIRQLKKIPTNTDDSKKKITKELTKEKENKDIINSVEPVLSLSNERQDNEEVVLKENKNPSGDTINDIINLVAKGCAKDKVEAKKDDNSNKSTVSNFSLSEKPAISISDDNSNSEKKQEQSVKLPENLPENVLEIVNKLKETAPLNTESNTRIFSDAINNLLLSLERNCRCLGKPSKSKIFYHLAPFLKCKKETLLRRAKKLVLESDKNRISVMVVSLKAKIDVLMPPLLENYERESQKIVQKKFSKESFENEENKQLRMPKRRFVWNEETKKLFKDVIMLRKRCFLLEGKSKETLEDEMKNYLKNEMKVLWPDGWMSITALFKMYTNFNERKSLLSKTNTSVVVSDLEISPIPNKERQTVHVDKPKQPNFTKDTLNVSSNNVNNNEVVNISTKDLSKITSSSSLSITPILPNKLDAPKPKSVKNELSINLVESDNTKNSLNVSFTKPATPEPPVKPIETTIKTIKEPLPKSDNLSEKVATFINLPQKSLKADKLIKPNKPPTDHKIENIIGTNKHEKVKTSFALLDNNLEAFNKVNQEHINNLIQSKEKTQLKPENLVKTKSDHSSENLLAQKLGNLLPENLSKPKHDNMIENLSKPKLTTESTDNKLIKPQEKIIKVKSMSELKGKPISSKLEPPSEVIILDDTIMDPIKEIKPVEKKTETQIIDLTSGSELKRKTSSKPKTKYHDHPVMKQRINTSEQQKRPGLTGNSIIDNLLQENLVETEQFYNIKKKAKLSENMKEIKPTLNALHKQFNDGDDIQKVMEDLKVLQNMVTPVKTNDSLTPSPVSVIAFNTNYMPKKNAHEIKPEIKPDMGLGGFQDAFQKQFLKSMSINSTTATSSKNFNSCHSNSLPSLPEKFYSSSNNNYNQHNSAKYKTNYSTQQQGTYNLMDDMLANFITEYAYPKTANHKPKPSQK